MHLKIDGNSGEILSDVIFHLKFSKIPQSISEGEARRLSTVPVDREGGSRYARYRGIDTTIEDNQD